MLLNFAKKNRRLYINGGTSPESVRYMLIFCSWFYAWELLSHSPILCSGKLQFNQCYSTNPKNVVIRYWHRTRACKFSYHVRAVYSFITCLDHLISCAIVCKLDHRFLRLFRIIFFVTFLHFLLVEILAVADPGGM